LARREKAILGKLEIIIHVRHDTPTLSEYNQAATKWIPGNGLSWTEADGSAIEECSCRSAESLGMKTAKQRHRDKDKCRCRHGKIGRFACHITKNIARGHGHSPTNRCVIIIFLVYGVARENLRWLAK
jgi:hypothetical protein